MKITMSLIVATLLLLTSTSATALEPAFHGFQKDEYGFLTAEDQRTFDKEYNRAQIRGYVSMSFHVRHHGETRSDDPMERIEQGRRYAQLKKAILKDLEQDIVYLNKDIAPTRSYVFLEVTPAGLFNILNDNRINLFVVYRRAVIKRNAAQTTDSIVEALGVSVAN